MKIEIIIERKKLGVFSLYDFRTFRCIPSKNRRCFVEMKYYTNTNCRTNDTSREKVHIRAKMLNIVRRVTSASLWRTMADKYSVLVHA